MVAHTFFFLIRSLWVGLPQNLGFAFSVPQHCKKKSELWGASPSSQSRNLRETGKFPPYQETVYRFLVDLLDRLRKHAPQSSYFFLR